MNQHKFEIGQLVQFTFQGNKLFGTIHGKTRLISEQFLHYWIRPTDKAYGGIKLINQNNVIGSSNWGDPL